jgi:hypothetical protein
MGLAAPAHAAPDDPYRKLRLDSGLFLPYPLDNLFRGWVECTGRGHHKALDIGGVGDDYGVGTPIRAMAKAKVIAIGRPEDDADRFGTPLTGVSTVERSGHTLPASRQIAGYGTVHFFTRDYGRHRSGGQLSLLVLEGPLAKHELHYLHIAAVHPDLEVGDTVEAGAEIALMGGTAVLDAPPHLHLSIEAPDGKSVDVGKVLGIGSTRVPCGSGDATRQAIRARYTKAAKILMSALRKQPLEELQRPAPLTLCGAHVVTGDFASGVKRVHSLTISPLLDAEGKPIPFTIEHRQLAGKRWAPRIQVKTTSGIALFTGTLTTLQARRIASFKSEGSGRRGPAKVIVTPKKDEPLLIEALPWPADKRALRDAQFELVIDRPCPPQ